MVILGHGGHVGFVKVRSRKAVQTSIDCLVIRTARTLRTDLVVRLLQHLTPSNDFPFVVTSCRAESLYEMYGTSLVDISRWETISGHLRGMCIQRQ
jgi:hypothetical protein